MKARSRGDRPRTTPDPTGNSTGFLPRLRDLFDPRGPFAVPLLLLVLTRIAASVLTHAPAEDAFITFRYARNFASGHGLVYNPGENVMGFTSPLWTVWCAAGYALFRDPILWARLWAGAADAVALLVATQLLLRHASRTAAWAFAGFFAVWPYFAFASASGMETSLLLALLLLAAGACAAGSAAAGPVLALLALTRPEGLAAAVVLAVGARPRDRLVAAALTAAGLGALAWHFGSIVPQSVTSKAAIYGAAGPWAGRHWWEWLSPVILGRFTRVGDTATLTFFTLLWAPAIYYGARELWRARATPLARAALAAVGIGLDPPLCGPPAPRRWRAPRWPPSASGSATPCSASPTSGGTCSCRSPGSSSSSPWGFRTC